MDYLARDFRFWGCYAVLLAQQNANAGDMAGHDYWRGWGWAVERADEDCAGRPQAEVARRNQERLGEVAAMIGVQLEQGNPVAPALLGKRAGCQMIEIHLQSRPPAQAVKTPRNGQH